MTEWFFLWLGLGGAGYLAGVFITRRAHELGAACPRCGRGPHLK